MKNLIIGVVGNESLHKYWIGENHDLFLVYYGDDEANKNKYESQADHYAELKGTKFNIIFDLYLKYKNTIDQYEYVFIPDDDVFIYSKDIEMLFEITKEYDLYLTQPAIMGYYSIGITLPVPCQLLRYTNYVEIMCPCFEIEAFKKLHHTFNYNKSCWGIDLLWNLKLNNPKDKIAIVDDVIAIHTRPIYCGDNYSNNSVNSPYGDIEKICEHYKITTEKLTYKYVHNSDTDNPDEKQITYPKLTNVFILICWES